MKADAADAITPFKCKEYIFWRRAVNAVDQEWKGR
jgi:hypothetical protein